MTHHPRIHPVRYAVSVTFTRGFIIKKQSINPAVSMQMRAVSRFHLGPKSSAWCCVQHRDNWIRHTSAIQCGSVDVSVGCPGYVWLLNGGGYRTRWGLAQGGGDPRVDYAVTDVHVDTAGSRCAVRAVGNPGGPMVIAMHGFADHPAHLVGPGEGAWVGDQAVVHGQTARKVATLGTASPQVVQQLMSRNPRVAWSMRRVLLPRLWPWGSKASPERGRRST